MKRRVPFLALLALACSSTPQARAQTAAGPIPTLADLAQTAAYAAAHQKADGGFAAGPGQPSTLGATNTGLRVLEYVGGSVPDVVEFCSTIASSTIKSNAKAVDLAAAIARGSSDTCICPASLPCRTRHAWEYSRVDQETLDYYATPGASPSLMPTTSRPPTSARSSRSCRVCSCTTRSPSRSTASTSRRRRPRRSTNETRLGCWRSREEVDDRPLDERAAAGNRVGARCHAFSRVTVAFLRAAGVPARARCGFGTYFRPGWFEDHWVAEYWNAAEARWQMVDAQLDATWRKVIGFAGDQFAITPTEFVTAGHAWQAWRRGDLDAGPCGLSVINEHGAYWIAGNLRLDLASLNKVEMLPWDVWGADWEPGEEPTDEQLELFDAVAALTVDPDTRASASCATATRPMARCGWTAPSSMSPAARWRP